MTCKDSPTNCTLCILGKVMKYDTKLNKGVCVDKCPSDYYADSRTRTCECKIKLNFLNKKKKKKLNFIFFIFE